jgi:acyl-CoA synthetase (NDP forming)
VRNLQRCLNPESIAVIGGREAERVIRQCQKLGFSGDIWPVNSRRSQLAEIDCYASIGDLPEPPDIAFVAIPAAPTVSCVSELASQGAGGVICYASGFREVGDSMLHEALLKAAGEMPVIGPNCYGYINAINGAALWPDQHGLGRCDKGVAIFSSSGNVSVNFTMQQRSLDIALIVSVGNQAMVGIEHCIDAVLDDPRITAIGIHIEGLSYLAFFIELCRKAAIKNKPVIVLKTGRSNTGARITMSHTATLAGEAALYDNLFLRTGVGQVHDVEAFLEALKLVSVVGPIRGGKIASMSCSGGEASLIADLSEHRSISFPPLNADHKNSVQKTLNEFVSVDNPLDYHTFIWGDKARMFNTFSAMLRGDFDLTLLILDYPCVNECDMSEWISAGEAFAEACAATEKKGAIVANMAESMNNAVRESLIAAGVAPLMGIQSALAAIEAVSTVCCIVEPLPIVHPEIADPDCKNGANISEYSAKQQLAEFGLAVAKGEIANSKQEAICAAEKIGFPVALKVSSSNISHKSEIDGVVLDLQSTQEVEAHCERLLGLTGSVLVEEMLSKGVAELLLGVSIDSQFGHYIVIGFGGTLVELIADRAIILLPASDQQILEAIEKLRVHSLLKGFRDKAPGDLDAVVRSVHQLASFVDANRAQLLEVDINPLIVGPKDFGAVAADALLVFRDPELPNH